MLSRYFEVSCSCYTKILNHKQSLARCQEGVVIAAVIQYLSHDYVSQAPPPSFSCMLRRLGSQGIKLVTISVTRFFCI